jgi:acyl-CoA synthetase (AMP-forming)/AMP-acid ligase II
VLRDGWLLTGDLARVDEDGYFFIVDRKEMIIRGGFNVYPREVEEVRYEHPAMLEAAVIDVPDEAMGDLGEPALRRSSCGFANPFVERIMSSWARSIQRNSSRSVAARSSDA